MVPLGNAHRSGGWVWDEGRKRQYADDLFYAGHLIAVQNSANRAKGADGPEEWRPADRSYWCQYAIDWITIRNTWKLTATDAEAASLSEMLNTCTPQRTLTTVKSEAPRPDAIPATPASVPQQTSTPTAPPTSVTRPVATPAPTSGSEAVYDSCDEAEAASEPRVLGSAGDGWGFPKSKVPSDRDGDGDGVVCEESRPSASTPVESATALPATPTPPPQPTDIPTSTPGSGAVYESCDAAEAAGETRVQGDEGTGWGFPASMVPSARDGDGDSVVCEESRPSASTPVTTASAPVATPTSASQPTAVPTPTPASEAVYESCSEAEAAGEQRVRGSNGEGRGFPASMVPSARDGDGDGVVCET